MQAKIGTLCNANFGTNKHNAHAPTYKGMEKSYGRPTMWGMSFGFALMILSIEYIAKLERKVFQISL